MKIRWFVPIIPLAVLALALAGGSAVVWQFFIFVVFIYLVGFVWAVAGSRNVEARSRTSADTCYAGGKLEQEFELENTGRLPAPVIDIQELSDIPGYANRRTVSFTGRGANGWRTTVECGRRGSYSLGQLRVTVSDPLGLFPISRRLGNGRQVTVFPRTYDLPHFQVIPSQEAGRSPRRWMASEAGSGASKVREYTSGDSLRHVHWPTTAHSGRLMVKEFDPERANYAFRNVWVALDMFGEHRYGSGDNSVEEYLVTAAASLVRKFLREGKEVGLLATGDRTVVFPPAGGGAQENRIFRSLSVLRASGWTPLTTLLSAEADRFDAGGAIIVVMPAARQDIVSALRRPINRGSHVTAVLVDLMSFGGPFSAEADTRRLEAGGLNVYTLRGGESIAGALDSGLITGAAGEGAAA